MRIRHRSTLLILVNTACKVLTLLQAKHMFRPTAPVVPELHGCFEMF